MRVTQKVFLCLFGFCLRIFRVFLATYFISSLLFINLFKLNLKYHCYIIVFLFMFCLFHCVTALQQSCLSYMCCVFALLLGTIQVL